MKHIDALSVATGVDFRPFTKEGFLFSPNAYPGEFDAIGVVTVTLYAEGTFHDEQDQRWGWAFKPVDAQAALAEARRRTVDMGANALVNVSIRAASRIEGIVTVPGMEVSGFAIRRK